MQKKVHICKCVACGVDWQPKASNYAAKTCSPGCARINRQRAVKRNADVNDPLALEWDHIIPIARGGAHVLENLQVTCRACNAWKSDKELYIGGMAA